MAFIGLFGLCWPWMNFLSKDQPLVVKIKQNWAFSNNQISKPITKSKSPIYSTVISLALREPPSLPLRRRRLRMTPYFIYIPMYCNLTFSVFLLLATFVMIANPDSQVYSIFCSKNHNFEFVFSFIWFWEKNRK